MGIHLEMKDRMLKFYKARNKHLQEENGRLVAQILAIHANKKKPLREDQRRELIESFEVRAHAMRKELERTNEVVKTQNFMLDKLHYVWCSGCENGMHRQSENDLTEEKLIASLAHMNRAKIWFMNHQFRKLGRHEFDAWKKHFLDRVKWYVD